MGAETHRPRANIERDLRLGARRGGGGGGADAADVEDHVAATALEAVDEELPARGTAPHGARDGHLAHEHERGGGVHHGDVVHINVALAVVTMCVGVR